jgi:hypothetical protein
MNIQEIENTLAGFTGTEHYYPTMLRGFRYTDGVQWLAEVAQCHWLIDAIVSYQLAPQVRGDHRLRHFQVWELQVNEDSSAVLTCYRDSDDPAFGQDIEYTDYPAELAPRKFYVCDGVLMLPNEY